MNRLEQQAPELAQALAHRGFMKNLARRCAIAAITLGLLATAAAGLGIADYQLVFPRWVRLAGGGIMLAALAAGSLWLWREWNRFSSARRVALHLERKHPELGCLISTAVEYAEGSRQATSDNPYERVLLARLMRAAARESRAVSPDLWSDARRALPIIAAAGVVGGLLLAFVPDIPVVLKRIMTPWEPVGYTLLDVSPGTTDWPADEPVPIRAFFRGPVTTEPKITWRSSGKSPRTAWMQRDGPSEFSYELPALREPTDVTVAVARLDPVTHRITPVPLPALQAVEVRVTPPDYTNKQPTTGHQLSLSLLAGSRVSLSFEVDRPLAKVALRFEDGEELPLVQSKETTWLAHWFPARTTTYRIAFTDPDGRTLLSPRPYPLVVLPDHPPRLRWEPPLPDRTLRNGHPAPLHLRITDDHGTIASRFFWKRVGEPARASTLPMEQVRPGEWIASLSLQVPEGAAQPGDLIVAWAEASDARHRTADTVARSRPLAFVVLPKETDPLETGNGSAIPTPPSPAPEVFQSPWFELARVLHAAVFALPPGASPEALADLQAEVTSLGELLGIWLQHWEILAPEDQPRLSAVRQALTTLQNKPVAPGDREQAPAHAERLLAAIASLLFHAGPETAVQASSAAVPAVLERVTERERQWISAGSRWSAELKDLARQLTVVTQRIAAAQRLNNLPAQLSQAQRALERVGAEISALAAVNPLCSHQLLNPIRQAEQSLASAGQAAEAAEPGQAARELRGAVQGLMASANRFDEETGPGPNPELDRARDLPGDPMEAVLRQYFRRIGEGTTENPEPPGGAPDFFLESS